MSEGSDKRSVATDALETLGTSPLDTLQKRDAIHLAVEPVIAGEKLKPGDHITVINGRATKTEVGKGLGIVDPFLTKPVRYGERFWFVMYPRKVHSLRHVWTHPSFPDEVGTSSTTPTKEESEKWLKDFCDDPKRDIPDYNTVIELIDKGTLPSVDPEYYGAGGTISEDYMHFSGRDAHGEIPPEFWAHAENVLGRKLEHHPTSLSCGC